MTLHRGWLSPLQQGLRAESTMLPAVGSRVLPALVALAAAGAAWWLLPHPALPLLLGSLPLAAIAIVRAPLLPIIGFVVFSFFRIHDIFRFLEPFKLPQLLALASLATLAWHIVLSGRIRPYMNRELWIFLAMFTVITLGIPFASNLGHSLEVWSSTYIKIAVITFAMAWLMREPRDFALTVRVFVLAGIVVAGKALLNKAAGVELVEGTRVTIGRIYNSPLGDPNDLSLALLFPLAFCLALLTTSGNSWFWRLLSLLAAVLIVAAILATQSRGGLLGTVAVFAACAYRFVRSKMLLASGGAIALAVLFILADVADRSSGGAGANGVDASAMGRLHAWQAGLRMALDHPLNGVGIGNFVGQYFYYTPTWDGLRHAAHSTWFEMLGDGGFIAFGLLLMLTASMTRKAFRELPALEQKGVDYTVAGRALAWGMAGFIVSGTFLSQAFTWPLYILLGLVTAVTASAGKARSAHAPG